ncbi:hypothetical protein lerEdw1_013870 [Lerista edwardsae]|nr:hypothetical protein lerEdw1_013870 [Lerista edwardsae]
MPKNALVTLRYGPYRSCKIAEHRTFRLEGLQAVLKADGHEVILEEIPDWNDVQLIVNGEMVFQCNINDLDFAVLKADGHEVILEEIPDWNDVQLIVNGEMVFQCNINDLDFGGDGKLDPLCEEARVAVLKAY